MPLSKKDKQLALKLKEILKNKFGDLIWGIYCYGSRITRNKQDSDFDLLVLTNKIIPWETEYQISSTVVNFGIEKDIVFDVQIIDIDKFTLSKKYHPFFQNVAEHGISL